MMKSWGWFRAVSVGVSIAAGLILAGAARVPGDEASRTTDWPQWRGPNRDGISTETGWLANWPPGGPKVLWKASVGTGYSSVSVSHGMLYTLGNAHGKDTVYCFDAATGKVLWQYSYPCAEGAQPGTRMTPTVDGECVYTFSREGHLFCFDAGSGRVRWSMNVVETLRDTSGRWGYACMPLVLGEASPEAYRELSRAKVLDGLCWTVPVLSSGRIFCRSHKGDLVALDVHGP